MSTQPRRIGKDRTKEWFQTFPSWNNSSREAILELLKGLEISSATIALESHEDGTPHYHANYVLSLKKTKPQLVKYFKIKLPNDYKRCTVLNALAPTKSSAQSINYLSKEDPDILSYWAPPNIKDLNRMCLRIGVPDYETLQCQLYRTRVQERLCSTACHAYYSLDIKPQLDPVFVDLMETFIRNGEKLFVLRIEKPIGSVDIFIKSCNDLLKSL